MAAEAWQGFAVSADGDGVAVVTFTTPDRLNALTAGAKRDLVEYLYEAQNDDAVRVVVFTGTGRAFCAGDDISGEYYDDTVHRPTRVPPLSAGPNRVPVRAYAALRTVSQALTTAQRDFDKLTVAAINGPAIQSGLTLALGCDFRVASTTAMLGSATLRFAYLPDEGGHHLLVEHLGVGRALDFILRSRIVDAATAAELGLVTEVVTPEDLLPRALALAHELADGPQTAMRLLKMAIWKAGTSTLQESLDDIAVRTAISDFDPDVAEGKQAFRERRKPVFNRRPAH